MVKLGKVWTKNRKVEKLKKECKMKHYRFPKIKPEMVEEMKELREQGLSYKEIGKRFNVSSSTIQYHLNSKGRENSKKRARKSYAKLTQEQRKEKQLKEQKYRSKYIKERYNNDEDFRKSFCDMVTRNEKKRRANWKKKGLCSKCGRKREDKKWKWCENCREKKRELYERNKNKKRGKW